MDPGEPAEGGVDQLGLRLRALTSEGVARHKLPAGTKGVLVAEVTPDGPAGRGGIRPGDALLAVNHQPVRSPEDVAGILKKAQAGKAVLFRVRRGEASLFVALRMPLEEK